MSIFFCIYGNHSQLNIILSQVEITDSNNYKLHAILSQAEITDSNNYKLIVTCADASYVVMDESSKEAICDTSTGKYDTTDLTPCLRTFDPSDSEN